MEGDAHLLPDAEAVLAGLAPVTREIEAHDGRRYIRQVLAYRTQQTRIEGVVVTFSDVAAEALHEARVSSEAIVDTMREPLLVLDADLCVQSANRAFCVDATPRRAAGGRCTPADLRA